MKVIILAGGEQSTLNSEYEGIPKPMIEIGGKPLLWHIMTQFSQFGLTEFVICGGYRVNMIKEYFQNFYIYQSDITIDLANNIVQVHKNETENWVVTVVDTGLYSSTGKRVSMVEKFITDNVCIVTYGDSLSNINISKLLTTHYEQKKMATVVLTKPNGRNQLLPVNSNGVIKYSNQKQFVNDNEWINADCFVLDKKAFLFLRGNYSLEKHFLMEFSERNELATYRHYGYWTAIETKRDLVEAESLWNAGVAPWMK